MKKSYNAPEMKVLAVDAQDVITTSGGNRTEWDTTED